jgi:hypothetical protein
MQVAQIHVHSMFSSETDICEIIVLRELCSLYSS